MGSILTKLINAVIETSIFDEKIRSLGYHSYDIAFHKCFTINGLGKNPSCICTVKETSIRADELFVLEDFSMIDLTRYLIDINVPKVVMDIGSAQFTCNDPKLHCAVKGSMEIINVPFTLTVSIGFQTNGIQIEHIDIKPKITHIRSSIQLLFNGKDYSHLVNSMIRTNGPAILNFFLEFILKKMEESIMELINTHMEEVQNYPPFD